MLRRLDYKDAFLILQHRALATSRTRELNFGTSGYGPCCENSGADSKRQCYVTLFL
jgi:hypothetical protein